MTSRSSKPGWKAAYENLRPPGKIAAILSNTREARTHLQQFKRPSHEPAPRPVYLMTESTTSAAGLVDELRQNYKSPVFLNSTRPDKENWDRSGMANEKYRDRRDSRMQ